MNMTPDVHFHKMLMGHWHSPLFHQHFIVGGSATYNTDYTQSGAASFTGSAGTVVIPAGGTTATLTINPAADSDVEPDIGSIVLKEGDRLILCSDGLWDELNDFKIKNAALYNSDLKKSAERLIFEAEENGGKDNITVVGMDYGKVKINVINKNKNLIILGAVSILAILLLVFSIVIFYFYNIFFFTKI
jgi:hypothetical protein